MDQHIKKLNNNAASYIELEQYDEAISQLKKALHLIKESSDTDYSSSSVTTSKDTTTSDEQQVCCCNYCSLEECMLYSEENDTTTTLPPTVHNVQTNNKQDEATYNGDRRCDDDYYIYRRPIRVNPNCHLEGHNMELFLSLLVVFNLALAHHLQYVSIHHVHSANSNTTTTTTNNSAARKKKRLTLQKVLRLYELTYKLQAELLSNQQQQHQLIIDASSIICTSTSASVIANPGLRFNIIICNNLSQVHKISQNHEKYKTCLQQLLSMLMYVVDLEHEAAYNSSIIITSSDDEQGYSQEAAASAVSSLSPSSPLTIMAASLLPYSSSLRREGSGGRKWLFMDLDGFLQNTIPVILQDNCAMTA